MDIQRPGQRIARYSHGTKSNQIKDLVAYAAGLGIEIVPEIDMPGHVTAILAAYPEISCSGKAVQVATSEGIFSDILCPGKEQTFALMETLLDELCGLFPCRYFHIGGDEVPKSAWKSCPHCRERMREEQLDNLQQLQGYLQNRIAGYLKAKGKTVIAWNEAAVGGNLDTDIILQIWNDDPNDPAMKAFKMKDENGRYTSPNQGIAARHIARGGNVINSNMLYSYCDYPHAYVKMKAIYEADMLPQKCEEIPDARDHVLGGECLCWSEHIRSGEALERAIWPRYAVKGLALCGETRGDYKTFIRENAQTIYEKIERHGIVPTPMKQADPGPLESAKQMAEFVKRLGGAGNRNKYEAAQKEV